MMINEDYKNKIRESVVQKFGDMGVDEDTINELVAISIESLQEEITQLQALLDGENLDQIGFHTHTIKGVLLNVGLDDDAKKFQEIKHLFEEGKSNDEIKEITKTRLSIFF